MTAPLPPAPTATTGAAAPDATFRHGWIVPALGQVVVGAGRLAIAAAVAA
jgi:hypothetical protein